MAWRGNLTPEMVTRYQEMYSTPLALARRLAEWTEWIKAAAETGGPTVPLSPVVEGRQLHTKPSCATTTVFTTLRRGRKIHFPSEKNLADYHA